MVDLPDCDLTSISNILLKLADFKFAILLSFDVFVIAHQEAHTFRHASSSAFSLLLLFTDARNSPNFIAL